MGNFDRRSLTLERSAKRRSSGSRFSELGDKIAKTFSVAANERAKEEWEAAGQPDYQVSDEPTAAWDQVLPRFPVARHGYDCAAVDEHIAELEQEIAELDRELAEVRARAPVDDEVAAEIHRVGEQTSSILLAAHDKAQEITRQAQEQADRCLADAAASAISMTKEADRKLHEMGGEKALLIRERARLLDDVDHVSRALAELSRQARDRFRPEPEKMGPLTAAASNPAPESAGPNGEGQDG